MKCAFCGYRLRSKIRCRCYRGMKKLADGMERNCEEWADLFKTYRVTLDITVGPSGISVKPLEGALLIRHGFDKKWRKGG